MHACMYVCMYVCLYPVNTKHQYKVVQNCDFAMLGINISLQHCLQKKVKLLQYCNKEKLLLGSPPMPLRRVSMMLGLEMAAGWA